MPSKKKNTRAAQLQPQAQPAQSAQSDYDTDTANMTDAAPVSMAPPPARTNTELNLLVLRRYVPEVERIISIAPFAVVYLFSTETQQWEKSGTEGTLFVCQLSGAPYPRYNVVILNRKSLDNFIAELASGDDVEITDQYVILQVMAENGVPNIYGLWIFDDENAPNMRETVANSIEECAIRAEHARAATNGDDEDEEEDMDPPSHQLDGIAGPNVDVDASPAPPKQTTGQPIDLVSLFNKPSTPAQQPMPKQNQAANQQAHPNYMAQPIQFASTSDTDFFRSSHSPAIAPQQTTRAPPQQNALLDLFKSAKKG